MDALVTQDYKNKQCCTITQFKEAALSLGIKLDQHSFRILLDVYKDKPSDDNNLDIKYAPAIKNIVSKLDRQTDKESNVPSFKIMWGLSHKAMQVHTQMQRMRNGEHTYKTL